jgi:hypothetical protein
MEKIFCPLVKGDCRFDCVFNNGCFDLGDAENCSLFDAVRTLQSLQAPDNQIDKRLMEIKSELSDISSDTNDISYTKSEVEEIKNVLKEDLQQIATKIEDIKVMIYNS